MIEFYIRPLYQKLLVDPVAILLKKAASPNFLTFLSCMVGILIAPALIYEKSWLALTLLLMSGYLDTLDGTLARLQNRATPLGTVLDIFSDRLVEFSVILGLCLVSPQDRGILSFLMLGAVLLCVTAFLVVGIFQKNTTMKGFFYSHGLMERPEAFVFFALMILLPQHFKLLAALFSFLVTLTAFLHLYKFFQYCKDAK